MKIQQTNKIIAKEKIKGLKLESSLINFQAQRAQVIVKSEHSKKNKKNNKYGLETFKVDY